MASGKNSAVRRYGAAVLLVAAAVGLNLALSPLIEPSAAPLLLIAVLLASVAGGWGGGLLATALAVVADDYFFITPRFSWTFNLTVLVRLTVFLSVSLVTSYLTSQRERLLEAERRARLDAEEANRVKDRFLAVTSHELRNPLSAICMWVEGLPGAGESLGESAGVIRRNAEAMRNMLDDLLDVSRIGAGKLRLDMRPIDLSEAVQSAVVIVAPRAAAKNIGIEAALDPAPRPVYADPARLQQVVANLLVNAVKFTPERGKINVRLTCSKETATLSVTDTGRGISAADLPLVFKEFWQASTGRSAGGDGLGLGLSICRELVRLQGGTIAAQSEGEGKGATFIVELPLAKAQGREIQCQELGDDDPVLTEGA